MQYDPGMPKSAGPCADKMKILSDETRLFVLEELLKAPRTVSELNARLKIDQSLLSHHLKVLREAGFVKTAREGKSIRYSIAPEARSSDPQALELGCCRISFAGLPRRKA